MIYLLIGGGTESTQKLISNTLLAFLNHPEAEPSFWTTPDRLGCGTAGYAEHIERDHEGGRRCRKQPRPVAPGKVNCRAL